MPRWLSQLRLSQKFLILGVLALVMVAIPTGLYIKDVLGNLRHADQEAAGMAPLMAINQAVQQIQLHRGTTAGMLGGDTGMANRRPAVRDAVNQALRQAQALSYLVEPRLIHLLARDIGGQGDVLRRGQSRDQVEGLEDKAQAVAAQGGDVLVAQLRHVRVTDERRAGGCGI